MARTSPHCRVRFGTEAVDKTRRSKGHRLIHQLTCAIRRQSVSSYERLRVRVFFVLSATAFRAATARLARLIEARTEKHTPKTGDIGFRVYALTTRTSQARFMVRGRRATGNDNPHPRPQPRKKTTSQNPSSRKRRRLMDCHGCNRFYCCTPLYGSGPCLGGSMIWGLSSL